MARGGKEEEIPSETAKFGGRGEWGAKKEHGKGKGERGKKTGKKWMR